MINRVQRRAGLQVSSAVVASTDPTVLKLLELANMEGEDLANEHPWVILQKIETHDALAAEDQGALTTIAADLNPKWGIRTNTMWNRNEDRPVIGPLSPREWQDIEGTGVDPTPYYFRVIGGNLHINPAPALNDVIAFEYISKNWCEDSGGTDQAAWAADDDVGILDEDIMARGVYWRWRAEEGYDYTQAFDDYQKRLQEWKDRDGGKAVLNMEGGVEIRGVLVGNYLTRSF